MWGLQGLPCDGAGEGFPGHGGWCVDGTISRVLLVRCQKGGPTAPVNRWLLSAQESCGPVTHGQASLTPRLHPCPRREGQVQLLHGSPDGKVGCRERPSGREAPGSHLGQRHGCWREHRAEWKLSGQLDHLFDLI